MKRFILLIVPALALPIGLLNPARSTNPPEIDSDADSLPDDFEIFYGLNPADPSDTWPDYDGDTLSDLCPPL